MIKNRINRAISKLQTNKRTAMSVGTLLFVLAVACGGVFLSQQLWSDYETTYRHDFDIAKEDINKAIFYNLSQKDVKLDEKINNIVKTQTKLKKEVGTYCKVNALIKWQSFIGQNSSKIAKCNKRKDNLNVLLSDIGNLTGYLNTEQKLSAAILSANVNTNKNNKVEKWDKIETFWRQAITDISKLTDVKNFIVTEKIAVSKLDGVADAWQQLSSANKTKNRQKFEEAQINLENAYKELNKISESSKTQVKKIITAINISYNVAFLTNQ